MRWLSAKSEFSKNVLTLVSGTAVAQLISLACAPILSRIFTPAEFGVFATYFSIVAVVVIFASGRYELAILLPDTDEEAINVFALAFIINILVSVLVFIIALLFIFVFSSQLHLSKEIIFWLYFIPLFVFLIGAYQIISNWAVRKKYYKSISYYRISNSLTTASSNIGLGILLKSADGLFLGNLIGNFISLFFFRKTMRANIRSLKGEIKLKRMQAVAVRYKYFPLTNSFLAASGVFQISGIIYFISYFFSQAIVGAFSYTVRVLQAPMNFIGSATAQVFYQQASTLQKDTEKLKHLLRNTIKKSSLISLPFLILLLLFGPELFAFVFGEEWKSAGIYARILSPWVFLDFIRATVSQLVLVLDKQKQFLYFSVAGNIILILAMLLAGLVLQNVIMGFIIFSAGNSILSIFTIIWLYRICDSKNNQPI